MWPDVAASSLADGALTMRTRWKDYRQAAEISWVRKWQEAYAINEPGRESSQRKKTQPELRPDSS
jgi:hypothetical protein